MPFLTRVFKCFSVVLRGGSSIYSNASVDDTANTPDVGFHPGFLLALFSLIMLPETSHSCLVTALNVRGTHLVGAYAWISVVTTGYACILNLALASFAPLMGYEATLAMKKTVRNRLTVSGCALGLIFLSSNLGIWAWEKLNMGYFHGKWLFRSLWAYLVTVLVGFTFHYLGMRAMNNGYNRKTRSFLLTYTSLVKETGLSAVRKARRVITFSSSLLVVFFVLTDAGVVQDALVFHWCHCGTVDLGVGICWILSTAASLRVYQQME